MFAEKMEKRKIEERKLDYEKKRTERFVLDLVLAKLDKQGKMEIIETEEPDFILHNDENRIGVEITKAYCDNDNFIKERAKIIENRMIKILDSMNLYHQSYDFNILESKEMINKTYQVMVPPFYLNEVKDSDLNRLPLLFKEWLNNKMPEDLMFRCFDNYSTSTHVELIYTIGSIPIMENGELVELNEEHPLHAIMEKKNRLLNNRFRKNHPNIREWWLCLEVSEDSTLSACRYSIPSNYNNEYTRVFMVDTNRFRVYEFNKL